MLCGPCSAACRRAAPLAPGTRTLEVNVIHPGVSNFMLGARIRRQLGDKAIRRRVAADVQPGVAMSDDAVLAGLEDLARVAAPRSRPISHFGPGLALELTVGAALACVALVMWRWIDSPEHWQLVVIAALGLTGVSVIYRAMTRPLPLHLDADRVAMAHARPARAGDPGPMPLVAWIAISGVLFADGAFAGLSLTTSALGSVLNPSQALAAAIIWGAALGFLLGHMALAAAREQAINQRRRMIAALMASSVEEERQAGQRMFDECRLALGGSVRLRDNRSRSRWTLALVIVGLSVCVFVSRLLAEGATSPEGLQAPAVWPADGQAPTIRT